MRDNDYTSNQGQRKRQMNGEGWDFGNGMDTQQRPTTRRRTSANTSGHNQNSAPQNETYTRQQNAARTGQQNAGYARQARTSGNGGYNNNRPSQDDYQRKPKNKRKNKHIVGKVLAILQAILSLVVLGIFFILNILPATYISVLAAILALLWIFSFFSQFTKKSHIPGKVFSFILCVCLGLGSYYLLITKNMLSSITSALYTVDNMVVVVMADDPAQSIQDTIGYKFGIQRGFDTENVEHTIEEINRSLGMSIVTESFDGMQAQVQALYDRNVGAIIFNEGFRGTIEEYFPEFSIQTRVLENVEIRSRVELSDSNISNANVTEEPFLVYISGNDTVGNISTSGRSDVNMLVAVNPRTKQILMVNTPRDYYVEFPGVTQGYKDKLTHAGNYGMDCSMNTLESIYGVDIDYYVRVNFSSMVNMVDALGGVTVVSDYAFTTIYGNSFVAGENTVNGEEALTFVRERKNLPGGDFQRGRNQQLMLTAMIKKAMSPAILTGYAGLISSVQDSFVTSMPENNITSLIKMQLRDGGDWNIVTIGAEGQGSMEYCYSTGNDLSVVIPDQASIEKAKVLIQQLYNGETLVQPDIEIIQ